MLTRERGVERNVAFSLSSSSPERSMAYAHKRRFDVVAVWKSDRFARSVSHLCVRSIRINQAEILPAVLPLTASSKPAVHLLWLQVETFLFVIPICSRRYSIRIEVRVPVCVDWNCFGKDELSLIRNLSIGGLFITTPNRHSLAATAKVDFLVPDGQIRAEAAIRHVIARIGLGLKFTALVKEDRPHLAALITRIRGSSRVCLDSSNSQLNKDNAAVIDLTSELGFEK
jgi:hypothetical protein